MNKVLTKLQTLIAEISMGPFGSDIKTDNFIDFGFPVLNGSNLTGVKLVENNFKYVSPEKAETFKKAIATRGDIVITHRGTLGQISYIPNNSKFDRYVISQSQFRVKLKTGIVDPAFFVYYFHTAEGQKRLLANKCHVGVPALAQATTNFKLIEIPLPNINTQKKIASILSTLDSKIELNNRINAELEAMAKTLYDYWFVQFDFPFDFSKDKSKPDIKPYKSNGGKMVWNEELKREVPEGWEVVGIEKCCSIVDCLHSKKSDLFFENDQYYLLQLENIRDDGLIDLTNKYYVSKVEYKKWTTRIEVIAGDIVITNAGRVAATSQIPYGIKAGIGRNITAIRPLSINHTYLFLTMRGFDVKKQIIQNTDSGAFFTSFNVKGIKKLQILRPVNQIEEQFEAIVYPIRKRREMINNENQALSSLRDWLLPMLMNGQVRVEDLEEEKVSMVAEERGEYGE